MNFFKNFQKEQNTKLQQTIDSDRKGFEDRLRRDLGALKEQLQVLSSPGLLW